MSQVIKIQGAREHNLKNINVEIPKNELVVITGPSGSGKSSLAFDTLYAEGQRRYVESLSAYARQFLGVQNRPDVDDISGLSPAISIEQKGGSHNPRSTVGTVTEIYDYLRLLFARTGTPYCPSCGKVVQRYSVDEIVDIIYRRHENRRMEILAPLVRGKKGEFKNIFTSLRERGFMRVRVDNVVLWLEEDIPLEKNRRHNIEVVVDRVRTLEERRGRIAEAVQTSLELSSGYVLLVIDGGEEQLLTENFVCPDCGVTFPEIEPRLFSFNSPYGACPSCSGLGCHRHFSEELAVDFERSITEGALLPFKGKRYMLQRLCYLAEINKWDFSLKYADLPENIRRIVLNGSDQRIPLEFRHGGEVSSYMGRYEGLIPWLERRWRETESENVREELSHFRVEDICQSCNGLRLRQEALMVRVGGHNLGELVSMSVEDLYRVIGNLSLSNRENRIAGQILSELQKRVGFLVEVGVGYLALNRRADTLSGGESQRIRLASQIGSKLSGVLYVLDEPTIGLHPRDTSKLVNTLLSVRDLGNTVVVVEHDRDTMLAADYLIEMGPSAGEFGGNVIQAGSADAVRNSDSLTGPFVRGEVCGAIMKKNRKIPAGWITVRGAAENNLKNADISIPEGCLCCISGVSGSGKSSFLHNVLYKGLKRLKDRTFREKVGKYDSIEGWEGLRNVVLVDQSPIGRTPRSNPATYTGLFSLIRELFSELPESKVRGYVPGRFSFNVRGGRCEACGGAGVKKVSMLFLPDVYVDCEVCGGSRYNRETLEVRYRGKNISDVLNMSVDEASRFFKDIPRIASRLSFLQDAGLGYIRLGQSALTLSGGEAQRVKLSRELSKRFIGNTLYLLDEPTTGLFYTDVKKLLKILHRLVDQGNTVVVIEHNLDFLMSSDYIIDLGPEGGIRGGQLVAAGIPEDIVTQNRGYTSRFLKAYLDEIQKGVRLIEKD